MSRLRSQWMASGVNCEQEAQWWESFKGWLKPLTRIEQSKHKGERDLY